MKFDTKTAARYAGEKLDSFLERAQRDTVATVAGNDIPATVAYYAELRDTVENLVAKTAALTKHIQSLSYEILPTMFTNQDVRTITVEGVGRATINIRWSATMPDKAKGMDWLRFNGNEGLIIETVNAQTLGSFAKDSAAHGHPLPVDLFEVKTAPHISITKA